MTSSTTRIAGPSVKTIGDKPWGLKFIMGTVIGLLGVLLFARIICTGGPLG